MTTTAQQESHRTMEQLSRYGKETAMPFIEPVGTGVFYSIIDSQIGEILLTSDGRSLTGLYLGEFDGTLERLQLASDAEAVLADDLPVFRSARVQLGEYFAGSRQVFDLPLAPRGTDFQQSVWEALTRIPYGSTAAYGELAGWLNRPTAARAVGAANGKNPIGIIVPCHRVIGANGSMTGYAWGEDKKRALLDLEATNA